MTFKQLVDRCKLFVDGTGSLLEELLREAEMDLCRECNIYEDEWTYTTPIKGSGASFSYIGIPNNFKEVIGVWYNGELLEMCEETSIYRDNDNKVLEGSPSKYYIRNERMYFDKALSQTGKLLFRYYAIPTKVSGATSYWSGALDVWWYGKTVQLIETLDITGTRYVWLDLVAGKELEGKLISGPNLTDGNFSSWTLDTFIGYNVSGSSHGGGAEYKIVTGGAWPGLPDKSAPMRIGDWHKIAPMIPEEYHRILCDYAIYVASNRTDPNLSDRHYSLWNNSITKLKSSSMDRELINNVKWEI